jgi:hypothetical protein
MKLAAILALTASIIYILFQALHPAYYMHLYPDVFAFHARSAYFWEHFTLNGLGYNEYQPGAIAFFILLGHVFFIDSSVEGFKWVLFAANIAVFYLIAILLIKMKKTTGVFLMAILLASLGPILLFRFDAFVVLLTIWSFYLWERNKRELGLIVLAFAVIAKVYPLIFLPYLIFLSLKKGKKIEPFYLVLTFCSSFLVFLFGYTLLFNIGLPETYASYNFHGFKSVATESVWATLIYLQRFFSGAPMPDMESAYGINAILRSQVWPSIQFYNYFWVIPVGILYLLFIFKNKHWEKIDYQFINLLLLVFLIFSKVLCNQYLGWFLLTVPLIGMKTVLSRTWVINIFLIIITAILHTFIYPLNYSEWLAIFTEQRMDVFLFAVMAIANLLLLVLALRIGINVFKNKNRS